jgi:hypothetical protein
VTGGRMTNGTGIEGLGLGRQRSGRKRQLDPLTARCTLAPEKQAKDCSGR